MTLRFVAVLPLLAALPLSQEPSGPPAPAKAVAMPITITLSYGGGTLGDFVAQIRRTEPRANIIVAPGAAPAVLPAIELRGAGLDQALEGACAVAQSDSLIRMKDHRGAGEPVYTILASEPVLTMQMGRGPTATSTGAPVSAAAMRRESTEVHSLNRLLDPKDGTGFTSTTVLSAVEAAVGEPQLATLRFHKDSGLLIFRGTQEQISTVRDVLSSLERDVMDRRKAEPQKGRPGGEVPKEQADPSPSRPK